jgi:hypothetical protein
MEKVTGGLSFAVLKYIMTLRIYPCSIKIIIYIAS